jgi:hypothetical protein
MSSLEYSGAIGQNPTVQTFIICGMGSTQVGTTDPDPIYCTAKLRYYVKFYNPYVVAGSSLDSKQDGIVRLEPASQKQTQIDKYQELKERGKVELI